MGYTIAQWGPGSIPWQEVQEGVVIGKVKGGKGGEGLGAFPLNRRALLAGGNFTHHAPQKNDDLQRHVARSKNRE